MAGSAQPSIINIVSAAGGVAGLTAIDRARRFNLLVDVTTKEVPGDKMPKDHVATYTRADLEIETTSLAAYHLHLFNTTAQVLKVVVQGEAAQETHTFSKVKPAGGGPSQYDPPEEGGQVKAYVLRFKAMENAPGEGFDTFLTVS